MRDKFQQLGGMAGKGFYIVLVFCMAVIAVSGYQIYRMSNRSALPVASEVEVSVPLATPQPVPPPKASVPSPVQTAAPTPIPTAVAETVAREPEIKDKPVASSYIWPVKGEILADFSLEVQAFDPTMGDWRTHDGIDIAAALGTEVRASGTGTVVGVYEDDLMGTTVVIDHGNGVTSLYANLAGTPTVTEGQPVEAGAVIGAVGKTAKAESKRSDHLHFEMTKDGTAVDPMHYMPKQS